MRIQGEGHYYTDGNGYQAWRIRIDGRDITRKSKTLKTLKPKVAALLKQLEEGPVVDTSNPTVAEFIDDWLSEVKIGSAPKTYRQYEQLTRLYVRPKVGAKKLKTLTREDCQSVIKSIVDEMKLSPQTAILTRNALRRAMSVAVSRKLITTNPVAGTVAPRMKLKEKRAMKPDEIRAFYNEAFKQRELITRPGEVVDVYRLGPVLVFLTETGLRVSELLGLYDSDITGLSCIVSRQLERTGDDWSVTTLKTLAANRDVKISYNARAALNRWLRTREKDRSTVGRYWQNHGFIFTAGNGEPLFERNLQRTLNSILKASGLRHYSLHDLRRTFGTSLANKKTPIHVVGALMGHADVKTTLKHYNTAFDEDKSAAVEFVSDFKIEDSDFTNSTVNEPVNNDHSNQGGNV